MSSILIALILITVIGWITLRDHRLLRASRRGLLDRCAGFFEGAQLTLGGDDFPRLTGRRHGRDVHVELIPDTMTIRRLPQLWLQVTVLERQTNVSGIAVLVRPSGGEFYSLTSGFHHHLDPPASFPREVLVRGSGPGSEKLLARLAAPLGAILADPRVKEVAITDKGRRIIRQFGEGRRGEHLLLRQAVFDDVSVAPADLDELLGALSTLSAAVAQPGEAAA